MPSFLILCLRSRDNLEPWPLMAFLLPPDIGGGRVGPGRAMPDQKYGPEIINDAILIIIINNNQLINSYYVNLLPWLARDSLVLSFC